MNRRSLWGWTLIETIVAMGLFVVVMMIVTMTLISTSRVTSAQTARSLRQASLQSTMRHVERLLQRTPAVGVKWLRNDPDGAVLATHCFVEGPITATGAAEGFWSCIVWDQQARKMYVGESVAGSYPAPDPGRFQEMPDDQIQAILDSETPYSGSNIKGRPIADRVTDFKYELLDGPLYKIDLELDIPPGDNADIPDVKERQRASVTLHPRNRI